MVGSCKWYQFCFGLKEERWKEFVLIQIWIKVEVYLATHPGVASNLHLLAAILLFLAPILYFLAAICNFWFLGCWSFHFIVLLNLSYKQVFYVFYVFPTRSWHLLMQYYTSKRKKNNYKRYHFYSCLLELKHDGFIIECNYIGNIVVIFLCGNLHLYYCILPYSYI